MYILTWSYHGGTRDRKGFMWCIALARVGVVNDIVVECFSCDSRVPGARPTATESAIKNRVEVTSGYAESGLEALRANRCVLLSFNGLFSYCIPLVFLSPPLLLLSPCLLLLTFLSSPCPLSPLLHYSPFLFSSLLPPFLFPALHCLLLFSFNSFPSLSCPLLCLLLSVTSLV